jgi:hypothetical protein
MLLILTQVYQWNGTCEKQQQEVADRFNIKMRNSYLDYYVRLGDGVLAKPAGWQGEELKFVPVYECDQNFSSCKKI